MVLFNYTKDDVGIKEFVQAFVLKHRKLFNRGVEMTKALDQIRDKVTVMMGKKAMKMITPSRTYRDLGVEAVLNFMILEGGLIRGFALDILLQTGSVNVQNSARVCSVKVDNARMQRLVELTKEE